MDAAGSARRRWNGAKRDGGLELAQPHLFDVDALDRAAAQGAGPCQDDERYTSEQDLAWCRSIVGVDAFTLDVAACELAHAAPDWFGIEKNGLRQLWSGDVWCNPPYSDLEPWLKKAWLEWRAQRVRTISMLLPATRTEQPWWQLLVERYRDQGGALSTHFLAGRPRFRRPGSAALGAPPFGCVLLVWKPRVASLGSIRR